MSSENRYNHNIAVINSYHGVGLFVGVAFAVAAIVVGVGQGELWSLIFGTGAIVSAVVVMAGVWKERRHAHEMEVQEMEVRKIEAQAMLPAPRWPTMIDEAPHIPAPMATPTLAAPVIRDMVRESGKGDVGRWTFREAEPVRQAAPASAQAESKREGLPLPKKETVLIFAGLLENGIQPGIRAAMEHGLPNDSTEYKNATNYLEAEGWMVKGDKKPTKWASGYDEPDTRKENAEKLRKFARQIAEVEK